MSRLLYKLLDFSWFEWLYGFCRVWQLKEWWHWVSYEKLFSTAHNKLKTLNPKVMPDMVRVHTWTRLGLSLNFCKIENIEYKWVI